MNPASLSLYGHTGCIKVDIRELISSIKIHTMTSCLRLISSLVACDRDPPSLPLPLLPIGTAAGAGGPQRGGPNGGHPPLLSSPLLPAREDVCSSEWELFVKESRA